MSTTATSTTTTSLSNHQPTINNNNNQQQQQQAQPKAHPTLVHAAAGAISGLTSALVLAPLDTIKTRLIVDKATGNQRLSILSVIRQLVITEKGGIRALYRGLGPSLMGYIPNWSVYFLCYESFKQHFGGNHVLSAMSAGFVTNFVTMPLWVVKTRMQTHRGTEKLYRSTFHALSVTLKTEGIKGLYSGLVPSLFGLIHVGIQFPCYEFLKQYGTMITITEENENDENSSKNRQQQQQQFQNQNLTWQRVLFASVVSKVIASVAAYPHEVLKNRLQDHKHNHNYRGMFHAVREIYAHEGARGFYNGMGTNLLRVVPAALITLVTYEMSVKYISQWEFMR